MLPPIIPADAFTTDLLEVWYHIAPDDGMTRWKNIFRISPQFIPQSRMELANGVLDRCRILLYPPFLGINGLSLETPG